MCCGGPCGAREPGPTDNSPGSGGRAPPFTHPARMGALVAEGGREVEGPLDALPTSPPFCTGGGAFRSHLQPCSLPLCLCPRPWQAEPRTAGRLSVSQTRSPPLWLGAPRAPRRRAPSATACFCGSADLCRDVCLDLRETAGRNESRVRAPNGLRPAPKEGKASPPASQTLLTSHSCAEDAADQEPSTMRNPQRQ